MALDPTFRTSQEYLNIKAGFTGPLRTKQECWQVLSGMVPLPNWVPSTGRCVNIYCGSTGISQQETLNNKVGETQNHLIKQDAIRRL